MKTTQKYTSIFDNVLIWFGAGISIAEIITGTYFADLGMAKGLAAIVIGHLIGCVMLYLAGLMGGRTRQSSMETVKSSFGRRGGMLFAVLNILQLLGWTAIMIYDGALAAAGIFADSDGILMRPHSVFALIIGALIILWILIGITRLGKLNTIAVTALFILTMILCKVIFVDGNLAHAAYGELTHTAYGEGISFGAAVELSAAMPLSWLPLISDYTREAEKPVAATLAGTLTYGMISCWMYVIGMGAALFTGESDIARMLLKAGLGIAGLIIVILSTVTTTFLDAWSGGISGEALFGRISGKYVAIGITVLGTLGAVLFPMDDITDFLYLIGSVFAPMIAVQITDHFILHRDSSRCAFDVRNLIIWAIGLGLYRLLMMEDIPIGNTLPDMIATMLICIIVNAFTRNKDIQTK